MADTGFISQSTQQAAADDAKTSVSQTAASIAADDAATKLSQQLAGVGTDDAATFVSQQQTGVATDDARTFVSQLCYLVGRGPQTVPPGDSSTRTFTFDAGLGNEYYLLLQLSDSGIENRDKVMKAVRVTGKIGNGKVKVYGYGPMQDINVSDMEQGVGQRTTVILDPASTQVQQSRRFPVNIPNSMMSTVRVEGFWDGEGDRDRIDEILIDLAQQGIRR